MRPLSVFLGIAFLSFVFYVSPHYFAGLNDDLAWPRYQSSVGQIAGALAVLGGVAASVYCSNLFRRGGHGTPVPIEPPKALVESGLYRFSRNPIYVADLFILLGFFLYDGRVALLLYAGIFFVLIQIWVVVHEEPVLRARFGSAYDAYTRRVPRWLGRVPPAADPTANASPPGAGA